MLLFDFNVKFMSKDKKKKKQFIKKLEVITPNVSHKST